MPTPCTWPTWGLTWVEVGSGDLSCWPMAPLRLMVTQMQWVCGLSCPPPRILLLLTLPKVGGGDGRAPDQC